MESFSVAINERAEIVLDTNMKGGITISHLLFADDVIIFAKSLNEGSHYYQSSLREIIDFSQVLTLTVQKVLFSSLIAIYKVKEEIVAEMKFRQTCFSGNYL